MTRLGILYWDAPVCSGALQSWGVDEFLSQPIILAALFLWTVDYS
jgi:hypothetical protein